LRGELIGEGGLLERGAYWRGGLIYKFSTSTINIVTISTIMY
jgi:hypothetical protein